jgi:hypothetical protein
MAFNKELHRTGLVPEAAIRLPATAALDPKRASRSNGAVAATMNFSQPD